MLSLDIEVLLRFLDLSVNAEFNLQMQQNSD
jgi:hypothetical protein